jgi:hypothetical protein
VTRTAVLLLVLPPQQYSSTTASSGRNKLPEAYAHASAKVHLNNSLERKTQQLNN